MRHQLKTAALFVSLLLGVLAGPVAAQDLDPARLFLSSDLRVTGNPYLLTTEAAGRVTSPAELDYAIFVHELVAYVAKEVLPDAPDEYAGSSRIPSRLSAGPMPEHHSEFGAHCLIVLGQIGSKLPTIPTDSLSSLQPSGLSYLMRTAGTVLAVQQLWAAIQNEIDGNGEKDDSRPGFSLNPKVGSSKVGAYLTIRW